MVSERGADEPVREGGGLGDTTVSELDEDPQAASQFSASRQLFCQLMSKVTVPAAWLTRRLDTVMPLAHKRAITAAKRSVFIP